jgi:hypothetical protein
MSTESQAVRELRKSAAFKYDSESPNCIRLVDLNCAVESVLAELAACQAELKSERIYRNGFVTESKEQFRQLKAELAKRDAAAAEMRRVLEGIAEYWNGRNESAIDAAETCRDRAMEVLEKPNCGTGYVPVSELERAKQVLLSVIDALRPEEVRRREALKGKS